jgi:hypothetical protein
MSLLLKEQEKISKKSILAKSTAKVLIKKLVLINF